MNIDRQKTADAIELIAAISAAMGREYTDQAFHETLYAADRTCIEESGLPITYAEYKWSGGGPRLNVIQSIAELRTNASKKTKLGRISAYVAGNIAECTFMWPRRMKSFPELLDKRDGDVISLSAIVQSACPSAERARAVLEQIAADMRSRKFFSVE